MSIVALVAALPVLYGLHRLGLYLESRDVIYYWHKKPSGGSAYNPLQELVQPQIRHVVEVAEHRPGETTDDAGEPPSVVPILRPMCVATAAHSEDADCNGPAPPAAGS